MVPSDPVPQEDPEVQADLVYQAFLDLPADLQRPVLRYLQSLLDAREDREHREARPNRWFLADRGRLEALADPKPPWVRRRPSRLEDQ